MVILFVYRIAEILQVDVGQSEALLIKWKWNQEQLLHNYLDDSNHVREEAGIPTDEKQPQSLLSSKLANTSSSFLLF